MPDEDFQLGSAVVEVRAEVDNAQIENAGREAGRKFGDTAGREGGRSFGESIGPSLGNVSKGFGVATAGALAFGVAGVGALGAVGGLLAGVGVGLAQVGLNAILAGDQMKKAWKDFGKDFNAQLAEIAKPLQPVLQ
ncbi:MAG TPA: hypothetical protein VM430_18825, partial [Microbacterium sp.]|nr:hypothetical protein [Microbacterium sp.]